MATSKGINDILISISSDIRRDDLKLHIAVLEEKRKRIKEFEIKVSRRISALKKENDDLLEKKAEIEHLQKQINKQTTFLKKSTVT